ncbi:hypothetical protein ACSBR1_002456 [Camellia fascicularis]
MFLIPSFFGNRQTNIFYPFSSDIWDPFNGFFTSSDIWDPFNGFFTSSLSNFPASAREASQFATVRIDWKKTLEAHIFKADLPGLKKEEVKVKISGERSKEQEEKNDKWHSMEQNSEQEVPPVIQVARECQDG